MVSSVLRDAGLKPCKRQELMFQLSLKARRDHGPDEAVRQEESSHSR